MLDQNFDIKIIDFGLSKIFTEPCIEANNTGSTGYQAPELFDEKIEKSPAEAMDIFSAGVVLFIMFTGMSPWPNEDDECFKFIIENNWKMFWQAQQSLLKCHEFYNTVDLENQDNFKSLIEGMLQPDPYNRMTI